MDNKMEILLEKTNIDKDHYQYFYDAKITKIKVNPKTNTWNIFIEKDKLLPIEIYEELENKKMNLDSNASNIEIIYKLKEIDNSLYLDYYNYFLPHLEQELKVIELYKDSLKIEDDNLILIATTNIEKNRLNKALPKLEKLLSKVGYDKEINVSKKASK